MAKQKEQFEDKRLKDLIKYAKGSPEGVFQMDIKGSIVTISVRNCDDSYHQKMRSALIVADKNGKLIQKHVKGKSDTLKALNAARKERINAVKK
ncbi:MAG: hypothetical protein UR30_C0008G0091 [Candidatus Peregrinibacteria bacterium GW2011_GWC2_33_13]|nr:MAG: hypothetical protein UR30_C0008G0091 [Candidatus Peregrinibacteria bacterium GW2011_GWC2_33_13]